MTAEEKKAAIGSALYEHKGLQHIVNVAADVLGNPIFVNDRSLKILAKSNILPEDEETWNIFAPEGHFSFESTKEVERAGIYDHLFHTDEPIYGLFSFSPKRFLGCRIRDKEGAIGFATIVENQLIQKDDEEVLVFLCKTLLYEMLYTGRTAMQRNPAYSLLQDIIEEKISKQEIEGRAVGLSMVFPFNMRLLVLEYEENTIGISIYYLHKSLAALLTSSQVIIYDERILILMDDASYNEGFINIVKKSIDNLPIYIGMSRKFHNIVLLGKALEQAKMAIIIGKKIGVEVPVLKYDDFLVYEFFEIASRNCSLDEFFDPAVQTLELYDKTNGSCLTETARAYLECGRNTQKTASMLFVHKNTLYYRLQKIEEICDISFQNENTCFSMQLTFRMMQFNKTT